VESIQIMGHNIQYLPREVFDKRDPLLGESPNDVFKRAYTLDSYLANVEGYEGDGDFFSKFGLEIRKTTNLIVARRTFEKYVPTSIASRPREGDLIYVPVLQKIFEIKYVEYELMFKALGNRTPYVYELRAEVFRYSNENIETGVSEVDAVQFDSAYAVDLNMGPGSGNFSQGEVVYQGSDLLTATATGLVKDWQPSTKMLQVINVNGEFIASQNVVGANAVYTISTTDQIADNVKFDENDNRDIQTEAEAFIDLSDINPFGMP